MLKRTLGLSVLLTGLLLISVFFTSSSAKAEVNQNLSLEDINAIVTEDNLNDFYSLDEEDIVDRNTEISEGYEEGDILSEEDTLFLLTQTVVEEEVSTDEITIMAGKSSKAISGSKKKYGTKVTLSGTMHQDIAFVAGTSSFRGNVKATRNSGSLKKVKLTTYHDSYGVVGWNGKFPSIGKVYGGKVSHTKEGNVSSYSMDKTMRYNSILSSYTTMWTKASVTTKSGDAYDVATSTWTKWH
jgi:hypothetical protein